MQTTGIREDDFLELEVRGQTFFAFVAKPAHVDPMTRKRVVGLKPLRPGDTLLTYNVTATQIKNHWRKKRLRGARKQHGDQDSHDDR